MVNAVIIPTLTIQIIPVLMRQFVRNVMYLNVETVGARVAVTSSELINQDVTRGWTLELRLKKLIEYMEDWNKAKYDSNFSLVLSYLYDLRDDNLPSWVTQRRGS